LILLCASVATAVAAPDAGQLAKDRVAAAEKAYRNAVAAQQVGRGTVETICQWSVRWLDSELDASKPKKQVLADHVTRMTELEAEMVKQRNAGKVTGADVETAAYFRIEAELWQARGKAH
jgi:hypothetical protein